MDRLNTDVPRHDEWTPQTFTIRRDRESCEQVDGVVKGCFGVADIGAYVTLTYLPVGGRVTVLHRSMAHAKSFAARIEGILPDHLTRDEVQRHYDDLAAAYEEWRHNKKPELDKAHEKKQIKKIRESR